MRACAGRTSDGMGETGTGRETRTVRKTRENGRRMGSEEKRSKMGVGGGWGKSGWTRECRAGTTGPDRTSLRRDLDAKDWRAAWTRKRHSVVWGVFQGEMGAYMRGSV
jgi:hypothetical protein